MTKDQLIEQQQHALHLASKMANCALVMTGGYGPDALVCLAETDQISDEAVELRRAAEEYNDFIYQMTKDCDN